jgi:hypothetical protein
MITLLAASGAWGSDIDLPVAHRHTEWSPTVIALNGTVRIRREGWKEWAPVQFGIAVDPGDILNTEAGSSVQVICADLSRVTLGEGQTAGAPCKSTSVPVRTDHGYRLTPLRGNDGRRERDLFLVSPRWTRLAETDPTIRWVAPPGIDRFQVTVRGGGVNWTRTVQSQKSLRYPADAPRLEPGHQYSVLITAGALSSIRAGEPWPLFEIASRVQIDAMHRQLEVFHRLGLSSGKTAVLEAKLLASLGFHAEAIERLEQVSPRFDAAVTDRILAATYEATGLDHLAVEKYRQALRKSAVSADSDGEATAADALCTLCQRFGLCEKGETRKYLLRAMAIHEALGAARQVKRLRDQLAAFD